MRVYYPKKLASVVVVPNKPRVAITHKPLLRPKPAIKLNLEDRISRLPPSHNRSCPPTSIENGIPRLPARDARPLTQAKKGSSTLRCVYNCKRWTLYKEGHYPETCREFRTDTLRIERCADLGLCDKCLKQIHADYCQTKCRHCTEARNSIRNQHADDHHRSHCPFKFGNQSTKNTFFKRYERIALEELEPPEDCELIEGLSLRSVGQSSLPWYQEKVRTQSL